MEYSDLTPNLIKDALYGVMNTEGRRVKMYTGAGGFDIFDEAVDNRLGFIRVYIGRKVPRIVSRTTKHKIKKSARGLYYKLMKQSNNNL